MMAQCPVKFKQIFTQTGDFETPVTQIIARRKKNEITDAEMKEEIEALESSMLMEANRKAFLAYQWGVWTTCLSRARLEAGLRLIHDTEGAEFIYCDTDSLKYTGTVDWSEYNAERIKECLESGSYATDPKGVTHYMGVFESEDNKETGYAYRYFKTLGAKKYAYQEKEIETRTKTLHLGDKEYHYKQIGKFVHCTIAGVNKKKGGEELERHGGLQAFEEGFVFHDAGGTMAVYNDDPEVKEYTIDGHTIKITSNVAILPSEYTLGITGEYERILKFAHNYLDNPYII